MAKDQVNGKAMSQTARAMQIKESKVDAPSLFSSSFEGGGGKMRKKRAEGQRPEGLLQVSAHHSHPGRLFLVARKCARREEANHEREEGAKTSRRLSR